MHPMHLNSFQIHATTLRWKESMEYDKCTALTLSILSRRNWSKTAFFKDSEYAGHQENKWLAAEVTAQSVQAASITWCPSHASWRWDRTIDSRTTPDDSASQCEFSNPKPSSSKQINNNFKHLPKRFHDGKCYKMIDEFDVDCPDNPCVWHLRLNMYSSNDFMRYYTYTPLWKSNGTIFLEWNLS